MRLNYHILTEIERSKIRDEYPHRPTQIIAEEMGISYSSVCYHAYKMKLRKSAEFLDSDLACRLKGNEGFLRRFPKGNIPHNKGKKMPAHVYQKVKSTMFAKGGTPHNAKYDGYERISKDGYIERRISKGVFRMVHVLNWEAVYGPVPANCIIVFKDKNRMNCVIENLECITREENCARNSIVRYPHELRQLIHIQSKLKKQLTNG
jgi:hypothetical protein